MVKPKRILKANIERHKTRLIANHFAQKVATITTFSPVSWKNYFKITKSLVSHLDLELHHMNLKIIFLNGDVEETIYMEQPQYFVS